MVKAHRIFMKYKDIIVLEDVTKQTAIKRLQRLKNIYQCTNATIRNYAEFNGQKEEYIIEKMQAFNLI